MVTKRCSKVYCDSQGLYRSNRAYIRNPEQLYSQDFHRCAPRVDGKRKQEVKIIYKLVGAMKIPQ